VLEYHGTLDIGVMFMKTYNFVDTCEYMHKYMMMINMPCSNDSEHRVLQLRLGNGALQQVELAFHLSLQCKNMYLFSRHCHGNQLPAILMGCCTFKVIIYFIQNLVMSHSNSPTNNIKYIRYLQVKDEALKM